MATQLDELRRGVLLAVRKELKKSIPGSKQIIYIWEWPNSRMRLMIRIDRDGLLKLRTAGSLSSKEFIDVLNSSLNIIDEEGRYDLAALEIDPSSGEVKLITHSD